MPRLIWTAVRACSARGAYLMLAGPETARTQRQGNPGHERAQINQIWVKQAWRRHGPRRRSERRVGARLFEALARPLSSPGMAYWMIACSVYLYIAALGVNVRICRNSGVFVV